MSWTSTAPRPEDSSLRYCNTSLARSSSGKGWSTLPLQKAGKTSTCTTKAKARPANRNLYTCKVNLTCCRNACSGIHLWPDSSSFTALQRPFFQLYDLQLALVGLVVSGKRTLQAVLVPVLSPLRGNSTAKIPDGCAPKVHLVSLRTEDINSLCLFREDSLRGFARFQQCKAALGMADSDMPPIAAQAVFYCLQSASPSWGSAHYPGSSRLQDPLQAAEEGSLQHLASRPDER